MLRKPFPVHSVTQVRLGSDAEKASAPYIKTQPASLYEALRKHCAMVGAQLKEEGEDTGKERKQRDENM